MTKYIIAGGNEIHFVFLRSLGVEFLSFKIAAPMIAFSPPSAFSQVECGWVSGVLKFQVDCLKSAHPFYQPRFSYCRSRIGPSKNFIQTNDHFIGYLLRQMSDNRLNLATTTPPDRCSLIKTSQPHREISGSASDLTS